MKTLFLISLSFLFLGCADFAEGKCSNPIVERFEIIDEFPKGFLNIYSPYSCIKAPDRALKSEYRVIHSFKVDVTRGDFIKATGFVGVTNPLPKPMGFWKYWVLSDSPISVDGIWGSRPMGPNITPAAHHDVVLDIGHWKIEKTETVYLNFVVYSASGEKKLFNEFVKLDSGYTNFLFERL